eukprot:CAMPEP_0174323068 /NCGR_PEP_ID=MMETSP0810-20121108/11511_1 /TAXON_ID=73025 ORGANISM="Eutreptiella gymnastica-like, Strain CCMP1594" /NCGR_SAMPLE_ID=MMETSP0810 /ASSEMBLY_ACC=CAM_ASM_000659 /LENGTH=143 /DNA_ID=CAMNT_0015435273 /DNA_START=393 /DNA_END=822 /DNA_ORIENTATION=+
MAASAALHRNRSPGMSQDEHQTHVDSEDSETLLNNATPLPRIDSLYVRYNSLRDNAAADSQTFWPHVAFIKCGVTLRAVRCRCWNWRITSVGYKLANQEHHLTNLPTAAKSWISCAQGSTAHQVDWAPTQSILCPVPDASRSH